MVVISVAAALILMTILSYSAGNAAYAEDENRQTAEPVRKTAVMPEVSSDSYTVISGSTSEVVIEKNADRKLSPGKITMLTSAMVVIDNLYNEAELDNAVDITEKLAGYGETFRKGEEVTVRDLLAAMLAGGNEQAAEILASYSASKRSVFINEMNSKAMELKLMDTHYVNPDGAFDIKQYSSAHDCAVIAQAAARYPIIRDILDGGGASITAVTGDAAREITLESADLFRRAGSEADRYAYAKGGIGGNLTQPTSASQYAGFATIDDMQLILVLMDSEASHVGKEAEGLFEYANSKVARHSLIKSDKKVGSVRVRGGAQTRVAVYTASTGFAYVPPEGSSELIQTEIRLDKDVRAPLSKGDKVGEYRIVVADELKGTVDLIVLQDVPEGWPLSDYYISNAATVAAGAVLLLCLFLMLWVRSLKRKRKRIIEARRQRRIRQIALEQLAMDEDRRARNWNYGGGYPKLPPRTTDIRRENMTESGKAEAAKHIRTDNRSTRNGGSETDNVRN